MKKYDIQTNENGLIYHQLHARNDSLPLDGPLLHTRIFVTISIPVPQNICNYVTHGNSPLCNRLVVPRENVACGTTLK